MIKKVKVEQLRPGIYIHSFNINWFKHPFLGNKKLIKDYQAIEKIRKSGVQEVLIDTTKGLDVYESRQSKREELLRAFESDHDYMFNLAPLISIQVPIGEEIDKAREIKKEARQIIEKISRDVTLGEKIQVEEVNHVIDHILGSLSRNKDAMLSLINIRSRDEYTYMHSVNVGILVTAFCKSLGMDDDKIKRYGSGALLHDIGKTNISMQLLNKPAALSHDEYDEMRKHVEYGREILSRSNDISCETIEITYQHHERLDGSGYPLGLRGDAIGQGGRLAAIVDVYDAITAERAYSGKTSPAIALKKLYEWSHIHFDAGLVQSFIRFMGIYPVGSLVQLESGFLGIVVESGRENIMRPTVRLIYDRKHNMRIAPRDLNLSEGIGEIHQIKSSEDPRKWNIDPLDFIMTN